MKFRRIHLIDGDNRFNDVAPTLTQIVAVLQGHLKDAERCVLGLEIPSKVDELSLILESGIET